VKEEREEESPLDRGKVVDNEGETEGSGPLKVEVGGEVDVTAGITGIEVGLSKQTSELPELTVIGGVALPTPLPSLRTITTLVPAGIDT